MNIKKTILTSATIGASLFLSVAPAFAAPNPKATGGVQYTALGLVRYASFDAQQTSNNCVNSWDVTGNYNVGFTLTGDPSTVYTHHVTLSQTGSSVSGNGGYPVSGGDQYHWNVTSGSVSGNTITLTADYDLGAPHTTMQMTGTINSDGTMSGTWTDNFGGTRTGSWSTSSGTATQVTSCTGKGNFYYADANNDWYAVKVTCAQISGNDAVFSGPVFAASNPSWLSNWLIARVHDGGTPGTNGDKVSGDFVVSDPKCDTTGIVSGTFNVTGGNLVVH